MPETTPDEGDLPLHPTDGLSGDEDDALGGPDPVEPDVDEPDLGKRGLGDPLGEVPPADPVPATPKRTATIRDTAAAKALASSTKTQTSGRATPKGGPGKQVPKAGRYTPPIPKEKRQSPQWFAPALLGFLVLGLLTIVLNYVNVLPGGTSNWYLISGIGLIVVGLFMATFYH